MNFDFPTLNHYPSLFLMSNYIFMEGRNTQPLSCSCRHPTAGWRQERGGRWTWSSEKGAEPSGQWEEPCQHAGV